MLANTQFRRRSMLAILNGYSLCSFLICKVCRILIIEQADKIKWNQVTSIQKSQPLIYDGFTGAFASFFQTGDPNAHKLTNGSEPGVPDNWRTGEEFVIESGGFDNIKVNMLNERCGFWREVAADVPI